MHRYVCALLVAFVVIPAQGAPLESWTNGATKDAIQRFVKRVSDPDSAEFVPVSERVAVFDNDGTLLSEQPAYFQLLFAMDQVKAMAPDHPEWREQQPFKAVLEDDLATLAASGEHGLLEIVLATHSGMTTEEFEQDVRDWLASAQHPTLEKPFTSLVYQPMLELLDYLRANGFKTYIVSAGGIEFMRPWVESVYGIPPEQVIGSSIQVEFELREGTPVLVRRPALDFIDDKAGKPVGIHKFIGRRPIFAAGNSDGDLQMLQWTTGGEGPSFGMIVHHTDAEREWAYDRDSHVGRLNQAMDLAPEAGWLLVDMKRDWKAVYPD